MLCRLLDYSFDQHGTDAVDSAAIARSWGFVAATYEVMLAPSLGIER